MKEHEYALRLAARGNLPETIDSASRPSVSVIRELVDGGLIKAVNASSFDGAAYLHPQITLAGREYLAQLRGRKNAKQPEPEMIKDKVLDSAMEART